MEWSISLSRCLARRKKSRIRKGRLVSIHCSYDFRIGLPKLSATTSHQNLAFSASDQVHDHYHYGCHLGACRIWSQLLRPCICSSLSWVIIKQQTEQQPVGMISPQCAHTAHNFVGWTLLGICSSDYSNGSHWKLGLALQWSLRTSVMHLPPRHSMWIGLWTATLVLRYRNKLKILKEVWKGSKHVPIISLLRGWHDPLLKPSPPV